MITKMVKEIIILKNTIKCLRISYLFPSDEEIDNPNVNIYKKCIFLFLAVSYVPLGTMIHLVISARNGRYDYVSPDLMVLFLSVGPMYFNITFLSNLEKLIELCKQLADLKTFGKPKDFDKKTGFLNKMASAFIIVDTIGVFATTHKNLFVTKQCQEENRLLNISESCGYFARIWLPFDYDYFPLKQIMWFYQAVAIYVIVLNSGFVSWCMMETIEHVNIRFEHACDIFVNAIHEKDAALRRTKFKKAVVYHQTVIKMGETINSCFGKCMMAHILLSAPGLGFIGYNVVTNVSVDIVVLAILWTACLVFACAGGQRLQDKNELVGDVLYHTEWYEMEPELQKDVMFAIIRSRQPLVLQAGPFGAMNNDMLVTIVQSSYSYLTLLQTI